MDKYDQEEGNNGGWQRTQRISDSLAPFVQKSVLIVDTDGIALKPDGVNVRDAVTGEVLPEYLHVSSFRFNFVKQTKLACGSITTTSKEVPLEEVPDELLGGRLSSNVCQPTRRFPIVSLYEDRFEIHPKNLQRVIFTYIRKPATPKWAYTLDSNGRPVYNSTGSQDFEAPDSEHNNIIARMCAYAGINLRENDLSAWSERAKQEGI